MDVTDSVAANRQRVVGFADVVRIPQRRWRIVAATTAIVLAGVLAYLLFLPATYTATSVVVLRPVVTDPFTLPAGGADRAINMTAETGVATGNEVVDATSSTLGRDAEDVRDALTVEVPTGGAVLRFEYSDTTEDRAVLGANTAAQGYLRVRQGIYQQQRQALLLSYDNSMKQVTEQREKAAKGLPGKAGSANGTTARTQAMLDQVSALNNQIAEVANQRAKIASADLNPGAVTAAARAPVPSSKDAWLLYVLGALFGGALLGTIAAHGREALDRRVRSVEQAADLVGVPALGVVRSTGRQTEEAAAADARYVSLALLKWIDRHPDQPLVVLSGRDGEGRTAVSGNLAVALAEAGGDVWLAAPPESHEELKRVLFAAQKRTPPRQRTITLTDPPPPPDARRNGSPQPGVTRLPLRTSPGQRDDPEATMVMEPGNTTVRTAAKPVVKPFPSDVDIDALGVLIGGGEVRLCTLGEEPQTGVVVVDAPPSDTDERGVRAAQSGVAVLVVARDRTKNHELTRLVDRLRAAGAKTVGFVLTGGRGA